MGLLLLCFTRLFTPFPKSFCSSKWEANYRLQLASGVLRRPRTAPKTCLCTPYILPDNSYSLPHLLHLYKHVMVQWTAPIPFNLVITSDSLPFVSEVAPKDTERRDDITNTKACDRQRLSHLGRKGAVLRAQCKNFLFLRQIDPKEKGGDPEQLMHIYIYTRFAYGELRRP